MQERYKKSSMTNKFRAKFTNNPGALPAGSSTPVVPGKSPVQSSGPVNNEMSSSKYRSHSYGALHSLDEFQHLQQQPNSTTTGDKEEDLLQIRSKDDSSGNVTADEIWSAVSTPESGDSTACLLYTSPSPRDS